MTIYLDIFSGAIFNCCYSLLKENPENQMQGVLACGLEDQRWLGMEKPNANP